MGRRLLGRAIGSGVGLRIVDLCERAESRRPNLLRVLTYHRVRDEAAFEAHLDYLASRYRVVSAESLLAALAGGPPLPPRAVMITFDDGYREVGDVAWPALRRRGLGATVFIPTAFPDQPRHWFWWDRLEASLGATARRDALETPVGSLPLASADDRDRACSRLKHYLKTLHHDEAQRQAAAWAEQLGTGAAEPIVLGWKDLRRLAREGLTLGAHTRHHPFLNRLSPQEARREVVDSVLDLQREVPESMPLFSYPDGRYCPAAIDALAEARIRAAFTTRRGTNDLRSADPLLLRRINVSPHADVPLLRARLVHSSVYLNRWRRLFDPQPNLRDLETGDRGRRAVAIASDGADGRHVA